MKSKLLYSTIFLIIAALGIVSCEYDDTELRDKINDHENRIAQLESLCNQMNTNISSLQTIVAALQGNDYVTSITPVTSGGETIGYTINFSKSGPVTIYHGNDGKDGTNGTDGTNGQDGHTPIIGVKQTSDGNYYWTLDGNWLLDDDGNKIKASGTDGKDGVDGENGHDGNDGSDGSDGKDGITPQLKIEDGYWYISYNGGETWTQLGSATGSTPQLGIRQDIDGMYYWTVNGEWLLDDSGNKVRANGRDGQDGNDGSDGSDGKDGITPQLKIDEGYWYISYDNGNSWNQLGKATGEDGMDGQDGSDGKDGVDGDSMFSKVTYDDEFVYLVLADNTTTLIIPRRADEFDILFPSGSDGVCSAGETFAVPYNLTFGDENTIVTVIPHGGWDATVAKSDNTSGIISVTAPIPMKDGEIIVLASAAQDKTVMRKLSFKQGEMSIVTDSYIADTNGDIIEVEVNTNLNYSVSIPDDAKDWISISEESTKAEMRNDIVILNVASNMGATRSAKVSFVNTADQILGTISVIQTASEIANNEIWYTSSDGKIVEPDTYYITNTIVSNTYENGRGVIVFENDVTELWERMFENKSILTIKLPDCLTDINESSFQGTNLKSIVLPDNVTTIGYGGFSGCYNLEYIVLQKKIKNIGATAFHNCINLQYFYIKTEVPPQSYDLEISTKTIIVVPTESVEAYKTAENWSQYASQIVGYDFTE